MHKSCKIAAFLLFLLGCFILPLAAGAQSQTDYSNPYSVAVLDFDNSNGNSYYGSRRLEPEKIIPAALTTELANSDRFTVVERTQLEAVLKEQSLGASGMVSAETAARLGQILGVEYLIVGNITEFNIEEGKSSSFNMFGIGGSSKKADKAHVCVDVKVIDTESARIVAAVSCRKTMEIGKGSSRTNVGIINSSSNSGNDKEKVMTDVYFAVAQDLADQLNTVKFKSLPAKVKYTGFVAHVEGDFAYINLGKQQGITQRMVFSVRREVKKGPVEIKRTIGEIQVVNVDDASSECKILKLEGEDKIKIGDLIESKF